MAFRSVLSIVFIIMTTSACTPVWQTRPSDSPESLFNSRSTELKQLESWKIKGRTAITQGKEGWNVGLRWQEEQGIYQIKLEGPFAQGGVTLDGNNEQVVLTMTTGEKVASTNPESLISDVVGWNLPVSALREWVRGLPYQKHTIDSVSYNKEGQITHLEQQGWAIEYLRYMPFKHYSVPSKIYIKHPDLSLRLIIISWDDVK